MTRVITIGELLFRLTPSNQQRIVQASHFNCFYGGAEANVAIALSKYGHEVSFFTSIPQGDIGDAGVSVLKENGVDISLIQREGERLGIYFYEEGYSLRQPKVIYDRKFSSVLELEKLEINWEHLFSDKDILHISGVTPALSKGMSDFTLRAIREAKVRDVLISFDFNYRSKLWSIDEAKSTFLQILPYVDICFAGYKDLAVFLELGNKEQFNKKTLRESYMKIDEEYDIQYLASTYRNVLSANKSQLSGYIYYNGEFKESNRFTFEILDRIGGGDAFAGGVLHGILRDFTLQDTIDFGIASSVLKHLVYGDFTQFTDEEVEEFLIKHGEDVMR